MNYIEYYKCCSCSEVWYLLYNTEDYDISTECPTCACTEREEISELEFFLAKTKERDLSETLHGIVYTNRQKGCSD